MKKGSNSVELSTPTHINRHQYGFQLLLKYSLESISLEGPISREI